jgi:drug/metabolite transporter (DMT)-like permease
MPDTRKFHRQSEAALLFVVLVWGINFAVVKSVLQILHPHVLNAFRFVFAATALGALYVHRRRRLGLPLLQPLRDHALQLAGLGILGSVVYQILFILGLNNTTAGNASLIMASSPLWTAVTGYVFGFESLRRSSWLALLVVLAGAVVVAAGGAHEIDFSSRTFRGNIIMIGAAICWGAYTAFSKPALQYVSATGLAFLSLLFALPILFGIAVPHLADVPWREITTLHWAAIVYSGALSIGVSIAIWSNAVDKVGASETAVFGNLVPIVAVLSSFLLLGESIHAAQVAGGALVIGGVVAMRRARRPTIRVSPG